MTAIIKTGGKQYKVAQGDVIYVEKLEALEDTMVSFDALMTFDENGATIGTPIVEGVSVEGKVLAHGKSAKVIVFKYKPKKDFRKKQGHRQPFTKVEITSIGAAK